VGNGIVKVVKNENEGYNVSIEVKDEENEGKLRMEVGSKYDVGLTKM
jgi:hypothetical protein